MRNLPIILALALSSVLIGLVSCNIKTEKTVETEKVVVENKTDRIAKYLISPDSCISISLLKSGGEPMLLEDKDAEVVLAYLNSGVSDEERNSSGIKDKMPEADCNFLVELANGEQKIAQLWSNEALLLYDGKWYLPISAADIRPNLEKYGK